MACVLPDGVESVEKAVDPLYSRVLSSPVKTALVTPEPQVKTPETTPQLPLDDLRLKPSPEAVAVKVAHVPEVYQVPAEMIHPFWLPPLTTFRTPEPLKAPPGEDVGLEPGAVEVEVGEPPPPPPLLLGRYLIPELGQLDFVKLCDGSNVPFCTDPLTL